MSPLWYSVLWSAIPVAVLLLASIAAIYGLAHRQPSPPREGSEERVERAYLAAMNQRARDMPASLPGRSAGQDVAGVRLAGQSRS